MGKAKRRRQAGDYPRGSRLVPEDIKLDIAKTVRSVEWVTTEIGGRCLQRAYTGLTVLTMLKLPRSLRTGRHGLSERRPLSADKGQGAPASAGRVAKFDRAMHHLHMRAERWIKDSSQTCQEASNLA